MRPGFIIIWMNIPHTNLYGNNAEDVGKKEGMGGAQRWEDRLKFS